MHRDRLDYAILETVDKLSPEGDVFGERLFDELKADFPDAGKFENEYLSNRCLTLEDRKHVTLGGHSGNRQRLIASMPIGLFSIRLTALGEDALAAGQQKFKEAGSTVTNNRTTNFNAPVHAAQLATGDNSSQDINLSFSQLLQIVDEAIESNPEASEEQKEEAKSALQQIREAIPTTAQLCTIGTALSRILG